MLRDARQIPDGTLLEADVCVIGAGAAGIAMAREWAGTSLDVLVLESGGVASDPDTQALYRGRVFGRAYYRLDEARTRRFGGSTHCWQGMCRPLSPQDFEAREWVPESGWPFGYAQLVPYYERAQPVCGLAEFAYGPERWTPPGQPPLAFRDDAFESSVFQINPVRFASRYAPALDRARNVRVQLNANVVELVPEPGGSRIARARVATLAGGRFEVSARCFVLATGGIENARLLLASRAGHPDGLGNQHGLVGRYFMEHLHLVAGAWLPASAEQSLGFYRARPAGALHVSGLLAPSARLQREEQILGFAAFLARDVALPEFEEPLARFVAQMDRRPDPARKAIFFMNEVEQAPNRSSRVRLIEERDALGMPRVQLEWRLSALDKRTLLRGHQRLARALGLAGLGRLQSLLDPDERSWPSDLGGGRHHMGTTRMHEDPKRGVVDANCRVHGLANLYVAGSSVFPTSGYANPTLTIVALALRLADHVKGRLT